MALKVMADDGRQWWLTERIGQGGEGVVYAVDDSPALVAKLVPRPPDPSAYRDRIERLVRRRREPRTVRLLAGAGGGVAWPRVPVTTVRGGVHGYLMGDLRGRYRPMEDLLSESGRRTRLPDSTWETALRAAAGLAALLAAVHAEEYLVGDLKPDNLWVDGHGAVGMADVDSWQFTDGGRVFACRMRTAGYTAPEAVAAPVTAPTRTGDDFVLAVVVHQLLMAGLHPFAGHPGRGERYVSLDDNLAHGRCRLTDHRSVALRGPLPPADLLPGRIAALLRAAFGPAGRGSPGSRPAAAVWAAALGAELADGRLRGCAGNSRHVFTVERPWCPWCDLARRGGEAYPGAPAGAAPDRRASRAARAADTTGRTT
ncbi:hypothetical protein PUR61_07675 [Streptomyces sp. BE20]|uniref:hypothetical protein n=1 Tax=Streptomyces sp. BE20 TaxID=3002525 RepID=UPI002E785BFE|nr:hypothetical protein [Streptomyces sp. BE20]MEE1822071.1 hypothetical protein [Streptomyces sp. BE20]